MKLAILKRDVPTDLVALGALVAAILIGLVVIVLAAWPPREPAPPVAKAAGVVARAVAESNTGLRDQVDQLNTEAGETIRHVDRRTRKASGRLLAAGRASPASSRLVAPPIVGEPPRPAGGLDLDDLFYRGVCGSRLYERHPECGGYRDPAEGGGA